MQFDFGKNWDEFSRNALTPGRIAQAREHFTALMSGVPLAGRSFLDIGFGQGLSILIARETGARVVGCDINPRCAEVLESNRQLFGGGDGPLPVVVGSILDDAVLASLQDRSPDRRGYDVVHSWGVLHHTGAMWPAVMRAASLTGSGGTLVLALYNTHWSSAAWNLIKRSYCSVPEVVRRIMVLALYPVIVAAKALVTRRNPFRQERGMDFYYDVVDWVGGYPYEHATADVVVARLRQAGFSLVRAIPARVPTGCNEFVFTRDVQAG